ncbi:hypothetical protein C3941_19605 [Kaistia algarum]|uniref:hypothetical protein n=1 Tax=Kaistia algarum TaxID=2083279 RepID=UPI000CE74635|nr:hypothetical protein [Kaistia algarum]MCX5516199.1 hypothetical protein [Kaistia algarum]PPE78273.1 hypothetical protein C3941_19605 [Kaistia algarum]
MASRYDVAEILRKAHAEARMIARPGVPYSTVFALRLRQQWKNAKEALFWSDEIAAQQAAPGYDAAVAARRSAILAIETKDRLTSADHARLAILRVAA